MKLTGIVAINKLLSENQDGAELLLRAVKVVDDDWRWVSKLAATKCAAAIRLLKEMQDWLKFIEHEDVQRMTRLATECSWRLADEFDRREQTETR